MFADFTRNCLMIRALVLVWRRERPDGEV